MTEEQLAAGGGKICERNSQWLKKLPARKKVQTSGKERAPNCNR